MDTHISPPWSDGMIDMSETDKKIETNNRIRRQIGVSKKRGRQTGDKEIAIRAEGEDEPLNPGRAEPLAVRSRGRTRDTRVGTSRVRHGGGSGNKDNTESGSRTRRKGGEAAAPTPDDAYRDGRRAARAGRARRHVAQWAVRCVRTARTRHVHGLS